MTLRNFVQDKAGPSCNLLSCRRSDPVVPAQIEMPEPEAEYA